MLLAFNSDGADSGSRHADAAAAGGSVAALLVLELRAFQAARWLYTAATAAASIAMIAAILIALLVVPMCRRGVVDRDMSRIHSCKRVARSFAIDRCFVSGKWPIEGPDRAASHCNDGNCRGGHHKPHARKDQEHNTSQHNNWRNRKGIQLLHNVRRQILAQTLANVDQAVRSEMPLAQFIRAFNSFTVKSYRSKAFICECLGVVRCSYREEIADKF